MDTEAVVAAGAGDIKDLVPQPELRGLREVYARSLDHTFAFAIAAAGLAVGFALLVSGFSWPLTSLCKRNISLTMGNT